jgi:hypothetical protein
MTQAVILEDSAAPVEIVMDHSELLRLKDKIAKVDEAIGDLEEQKKRLMLKLNSGIMACVEAGMTDSAVGKIIEHPGRQSIRKFTPQGIDAFRQAYPELYVRLEKITISVSDAVKAVGDEGIKPYVEGGERGPSTFEILSPLELDAMQAMEKGKEKRSGRSKA